MSIAPEESKNDEQQKSLSQNSRQNPISPNSKLAKTEKASASSDSDCMIQDQADRLFYNMYGSPPVSPRHQQQSQANAPDEEEKKQGNGSADMEVDQQIQFNDGTSPQNNNPNPGASTNINQNDT